MGEMSHINKNNEVNMVDVSGKNETVRIAKAYGKIVMSKELIKMIKENKVKKGNVITTAKIAGIMAAKKTSELIPLTHPLNIEKVDLTFTINKNNIEVKSLVKLTGKTGVEMEALTAVSVALLTIYDMGKAVDKRMEITDIYLLEKSGGKSGNFKR